MTRLVALSLLLLVAGPATAVRAASPSAAVLERIDRLVEERMDANGVPGAAVAIVADGRLVHARGFGTADGEDRRVTPDTPFLLGSTTKSFTALAVMQLVDAGKVQLDASVRRYVPEFQLAEGAADQITVRHVLQHVSGLPPNTEGGPILKAAGDGTPEQAIAEIRGQAPAADPGAEMDYVNANYVLAGLIVERASGEPFGSYVEREIFEPIGMSQSFADPEPALRAGLAAGHRYVFGFTDRTGPTFRPAMLATGYLMSSARDLARYLATLLNDGVTADGTRVVSSASLRTLLTPGRPETELGPWADGASSRYAMGWFVGGPWKEPAILHPGDTADTSSLLVMMPQRGLGVVTLVNASNELAVPGNPTAIGRLERNVVDVLVGERPDTGTSVHRFYLVFDIVVLALLAAATVALTRSVRDVRTRRPPTHRSRSIVGMLGRVLLVGVALGYPLLTGLGWTATWAWHPDLALVLLVLGVLLAATTTVRLGWLLRTRPSVAPPPVTGDGSEAPPPTARSLESTA